MFYKIFTAQLHYSLKHITNPSEFYRPIVTENPQKIFLFFFSPLPDEPIKDSEPNTVSLRREIAVVDVNDNAPEFLGRPYSFVVSEDTRVGTIIYNNITVTDKDAGRNSEISITCLQNDEPCFTFNLLTEKVSTRDCDF